jgi:hypothetical protein
VGPKRIFVSSDGAREHHERERVDVEATRRLFDTEIDWACKIERNFSARNKGCRLGVSSAISWFFEHVEEGIILEDDCIPAPDFLSYCRELLERYRLDSRVFNVCGSNFQNGRRYGSASYYFSIHGDSWGWATWRRAWKHYQDAARDWFVFRDAGLMAHVFPIEQERKYWSEILDELFVRGRPNTWDYQWWLACWMNNGLSAWPNVNLVSNVGWDDSGTHTFGEFEFANLPVQSLGRIEHPRFVLPNRDADEYAFLQRRGGAEIIARHLRAIEAERLSRRPLFRRGWDHLRKHGLLSTVWRFMNLLAKKNR